MSAERFPGCRIHPSALIGEGVSIGAGSSVWDSVHIRYRTTIGRSYIIGEKSCIAYEVVIGDRCKLNTATNLCTGVTLEDDVMIAAHVVFSNDRFPRAFDREPGALADSAPNEETLATRVRPLGGIRGGRSKTMIIIDSPCPTSSAASTTSSWPPSPFPPRAR